MAYEREQQRLLALWEGTEEDELQQNETDQSDTDIPEDPSSHDETEEGNVQSPVPSQLSLGNVFDHLESIDRSGPYYIGKDGTKWLVHKERKKLGKTKRQNIVTQLPGVKGVAKEAKTVLDCWKLYFPDEVIQHIVNCTNKKLQKIRLTGSLKHNTPTDFEEMSAFIGLLYLAGVKRAQHLNTSELWSTDGTAPEYFAATMSERRFHSLVQAIRFDDIDSRVERAREDNLAPVRYILDGFVERCIQHYSLGSYITVDEMLEGFRGRCKFRQYIANKPAKYGIKIYAVVDSRMFYTHNIEIYAGKQPTGPYNLKNDAHSVVTRLLRHCSGTGRNVTTDNYFTSVPLANDLVHNHNITLVGTLRKNKREVPPIFLDSQIRKPHVCLGSRFQ